MTGFEVAGIIFGVVPFLVTAIDSYEKIGDLFGIYRKYSIAVGKFNIDLGVQKGIFQNECVLLLSGVVEDGRVLHDMFNESSHALRASLRTDENVDRKLSQHLHERAKDSYRQILAILVFIVQSLEKICEETTM